METFKALFTKPDPQAQLRKCNALIRSNIRKLDRDIQQVRQVELKTKNLILQADRRAQRDPTRSKQAQKEVRDFARELVRARRTSARLVTSKAQLSSVQMQVNEAFAVRKIEGSIRASVGIMKDVNSLIRLPELSGTMRELSTELMKAGIIEEMIDETLPEDPDMLMEDDEAEGEVDRVLGEILKDRRAEPSLPAAPLPEPQNPVALGSRAAEREADELADEEDEDEEDAEAMMDQMRNRLDALRS
ncbi:Vacuolar protein-sorting-associated protein 24 [Escovopsis weberi]|uniref:Vacuolar protein-sorting-associated protein 24 n=1 Tax=Escovopsis weberi TaxID=150374 RepID=A0A0M9VWA1_ESCWE|nr:Vacuolar protein-sorting-associated protein 24 [Escovopsis weberi]